MPRKVQNTLASNGVELLGQGQNMWQRKSVQERKRKYYLETFHVFFLFVQIIPQQINTFEHEHFLNHTD